MITAVYNKKENQSIIYNDKNRIDIKKSYENTNIQDSSNNKTVDTKSEKTEIKKEIKYNNKLDTFVFKYKKNGQVLYQYPPQIIIKYYLYNKEQIEQDKKNLCVYI